MSHFEWGQEIDCLLFLAVCSIIVVGGIILSWSLSTHACVMKLFSFIFLVLALVDVASKERHMAFKKWTSI